MISVFNRLPSNDSFVSKRELAIAKHLNFYCCSYTYPLGEIGCTNIVNFGITDGGPADESGRAGLFFIN